MEPIQIITAALCLVVGLSLSLLGGGGSVLIVPLLVYVGKVPVSETFAMSLLIVGCSSALGSVKYFRQGLVNKRLVALFIVPGVAASFFGARLAKFVPSGRLLFMFGVLMTLIAVILYVKSAQQAQAQQKIVCRPPVLLSVVIGAVIGFLTGLLGVGGGFLIVPAITLLMRCSLYTAIGTSLVIITVNSMTGFIGYLSQLRLSVPLIALFLSTTITGALIGAKVSSRLSAVLLQRAFAVLIFIIGSFIAWQHFPSAHGR